MKFFLMLTPISLLAQSVTPTEHWGMTQSEVLKTKKKAPIKRTDHSLIFTAIEGNIPAREVFECTAGSLDQISYVA